ncbi:BcPKS16, polyketide synthase [Lasiosphaeria miniovina]|uniref:BcPKS16, polyketide synthase n=1 Tax=Lasiosphaeria miniovina TaxID=1954250 RepID=A0AA40AE41_9PEZI|nr:BcPKS16, polyketide synthase [Lasiosphaeria miniovina]KAK0713998.1 BcPKS16, polyketide synthase [Lasiosphaeria miniovina]
MAAVSLAVFGPLIRAPLPSYLDDIRAFCLGHAVLAPLVRDIASGASLLSVWALLAGDNPDIARISQGPQAFVPLLTQWLADGVSGPAASALSPIVALPRLVIIQLAQYFQFLESRSLTHSEFLAQACHVGGIQGYCVGLIPAFALSCATRDQELAESLPIAIRLAFAVGIYAELGDDSRIPGTTTVVIRLKKEGQAEELVGMFPHTYISAVTDPKSISIAGPIKQISRLQASATQQGLTVQSVDVRGKMHSPENVHLAAQLSTLCEKSELLNFPASDLLQVPARSNRTGNLIEKCSLTRESVEAILASKCDWFRLLSNVAADLGRAGTISHNVVSFGIGDCVPLTPFDRLGLRITKSDWSREPRTGPTISATEMSSGFQYPDNSVAVVGASCRLPGANNLDELWDLLVQGQDRHEEVKADRFDLYGGYRASQSGNFTKNRKFYGNFVDGVDRFDNAFFGINARETINMDPQQRILLELAYEAMECSGYTRSHVRSRGDAVGCFVGASFVEYLDNTSAHSPTAHTSTGTLRAFLCGRLAYYFGWTGPAEVIDTACSSSLVAINRAVKAIQGGECSIALAGGINVMAGANNFLDLGRGGFLSPTGQCKPFDKDADGYCRAEGAGLIVLKSLKQAQADGDRIMAVVSGAATNQSGLSRSLTVPESNAQSQLYRSVLKQACISPDQVTFVEAHGTGTQAGDPLEILSLRSVFGSSTRAIPLHIGSIKGNFGHCETAAGVAGLLKVICMLEHRSIPPQASHKTWNPKIPAIEPDRMTISKTLTTWDAPVRAALVNSYGAAGSNAAVLCCEAPAVSSKDYSQPGSGMKQPIIISAKSLSSLKNYQALLGNYLTKAIPQPSLAELAYTLSEKRQQHKHRVVFEASETSGLIKTLMSGQEEALELSTPKPVVLLFGGQSRQTINLGREFYDRFTTFRTYVDMCDTILKDLGFPSIVPAIFQPTDIPDIVVLQTGSVAIQYASAATWIKAGLKASAMVGHSLGELAALAVSGTLSLRDCLKLVATRATLMKTKWGQEKGAMLAVMASPTVVEDIIASLKLSGSAKNLVIACYNSDKSQVVSGDSGAIAELESHLVSRLPPVKCLRLGTSHGFHSHLVDPILGDLDKISSELDWRPPSIPIELCSETSRLPGESNYNPSLQARSPVFFANAVQRVEEKLGGCVWLEAGMNTTIVQMTKRAALRLDDHTFHALSTKDDETPVNAISRAVCGLWRSSLDVTHWSFLPTDRATSPTWLPPYKFDPTIAWLENIDHAAVLKRQLDERPEIKSEPVLVEQRRKLVTLLPEADKSGKTKHFSILAEGQRFRTMVTGHSVRNRPLCPASFYLECTAMALDLLNAGSGLPKSGLEFEDLDIQAPLGLGAEDVRVILQEPSSSTGSQQWEFSIVSRNRSSKLDKTTLHAKGRVAKSSTSKLATMARLVNSRMRTLATSEDAERMLQKRAYDLFSRVVSYDRFLQGISSITMNGTEAIGKIRIPPGQPGVEESTVIRDCDAVSLDSFIQVVGLLLNTSDHVGKNEVMICTGVDNAAIASGCNMLDCQSWKVHASYTSTGSSQVIGDVFAFSEVDGSVAAAFTGCRFAKLDVTRLERLLDATNRVPGSKQTQARPNVAEMPQSHPSPGISSLSEKASSFHGQDSDSSWAVSDLDTQLSSDEESPDIRSTLQTYTGVAASAIPGDAVLAELGLDSLAAAEMAEELGILNQAAAMDSQDILSMTVKQLEQHVYGVSAKKAPASARLAAAAKGAFLGSPKTASPKPKHQQAPLPPVGTAGLWEGKVTELLVEITGVAASSIKADLTLEELGVDSLALTEILSSVTDASPIGTSFDTSDITLQSTIEELLRVVRTVTVGSGDDDADGDDEDDWEPVSPGEARTMPLEVLVSAQSNTALPSNARELQIRTPTTQLLETRVKTDPRAGLRACDAQFEAAAQSRGFQHYWDDVAVQQGKLCLAYILEAFQKLGVDLSSFSEEGIVPQISYRPKHSNVVERLWGIVERHGLVSFRGDARIVRTSQAVPAQPAAWLHAEFLQKYPAYAVEARLLAITSTKMAECLTGEADPIKLLFGTASSRDLLAEYYSKSPMLATLTSQLISFISGCIESPAVRDQRPRTLRILEVGAGTGGTTAELAESLAKIHKSGAVKVEYIFTDISSTMVAKAKTRFSQYSDWMFFEKVDLEYDPPAHLTDKFDIILGTNCVHATRDRVATTRRIRQMLNRDGFMVLSEITRVVDWLDLVFGLLEGWWLADGGSSYPLQSAESWMNIFCKAGFGAGMFSRGDSEDANTQLLLIGCNYTIPDSPNGGFMRPLAASPLFKKQTVIYKEEDGVQIEADIFLPAKPSSRRPMPIALMVHGGAYMTLSRNSVRPAQTAHLLANGILPVSLDYRLCPEVNIVDGAMADVRDAYIWAKRKLPAIVAPHGIVLDTEQIVVIGWSTGGHLAMSTAWTLEAVGMSPPKAILVFYAPTDWLAADVFSPRATISRIPPRLSREQLLQMDLLPSPLTGYDVIHDGEGPGLGWVKPGDARSELVLSILREPREFAMSLMLNGTQKHETKVEQVVLDAPAAERQAAICPTARLRAGQYKVPTFIIHGDADELALFRSATQFHNEMSRLGLRCGFLPVPNGPHIHDMRLKPGMPAWDEQVAPGYQFLFDIIKG